MSVSTTPDDVRIVDDVGDGGKPTARARTATAVVGALVGTLVGLAVGAGGGADEASWSLVPALVVAGALAGHDLTARRLPDRGVVALAMLGLLAASAGWGLDGVAHWAVGALVAAAPLLVIHLVSPCSMGFGDVKFAATLGGLIGLAGVEFGDVTFLVMVALTVASAAAALGAVSMRRADVAFGPWLFVGTATTLVFAALTRSPLP